MGIKSTCLIVLVVVFPQRGLNEPRDYPVSKAACLGQVANSSLQAIYNLENLNDHKSISDAETQVFIYIQQLWWLHLCGDHSAHEKLNKLYATYQKKKSGHDHHFIKLMAGGYLLRMDAMSKSPYQAAERYFSLIPHLRYVLDHADECEEYRLIYAVYHAGLGTQNPMLQFTLSNSLPKPQKETGIRLLKELKKSSKSYVGNESKYFLYKFSGLVDDELRSQLLEELIDDYPKNIIFRLERLRLPEPPNQLFKETKFITETHSSLSQEHRHHLLSVLRHIEREMK